MNFIAGNNIAPNRSYLMDAHEKSQNQNNFEKLHLQKETSPVKPLFIYIDERRYAINHLGIEIGSSGHL